MKTTPIRKTDREDIEWPFLFNEGLLAIIDRSIVVKPKGETNQYALNGIALANGYDNITESEWYIEGSSLYPFIKMALRL